MPRIHHQNGGSNDGSTTEPLLASVSTLSSPPIKVVVKLSRPLKTPIQFISKLPQISSNQNILIKLLQSTSPVTYFGIALNVTPKIYLLERDAQIVILGREGRGPNILDHLHMPIKNGGGGK